MTWTERQLPEGDEVFLDHVGWFVAELDAAAAQLQRLGFQVSVENVHMNMGADGVQRPSGTINRLSVLGLGYLEFLGARGETPLADQHRAQLSRYEGLHLMAFNSADVPAEALRLAAEGFKPLDPVDMRRPVQLPDGPEAGSFSVLRVPPGVMAEGRVQWCGHRTPELVWHPSQTSHPNGGTALSGALWVVADVHEAVDRYSRFLRKPAERLNAGAARIMLERGALLFADQDHAAEFAPGLDAPTLPFGGAVYLRAESLTAARACLNSNTVPTEDIPGGLLIRPEQGLGTIIILHEGDAPPGL
jgi:hypothetical protein